MKATSQKIYSKICNKILLASFLAILFCAVTTAYAQTPPPKDNSYTVLAPLPNTTAPCTKVDGKEVCKTDLKTYLTGVFNWSIGLAAVMAFVMITFGGITYMTADAISGKSLGREYIENALWGLLLVIGAWILLYTINPKTLNFDLRIPKVDIKNTNVEQPFAPVDPNQSAPTQLTPGQQRVNNEVLAKLAQIPVSVNNNSKPCPDNRTTKQTGCTSLYGLPQMAISGLTAIKGECDCTLRITGGTEYHGGQENARTHAPYHAVVDLDANPALNKYLSNPNPIEGTEVTISRPTYAATYKYETITTPNSTGNHWRVVFTR